VRVRTPTDPRTGETEVELDPVELVHALGRQVPDPGQHVLEGPTGGDADNVSVQAFLSSDTVFNNAGDIAAGGTILGSSPLADLGPGESISGSFASTPAANACDYPYLVLLVDWGAAVDESDETNNTLAALSPGGARVGATPRRPR